MASSPPADADPDLDELRRQAAEQRAAGRFNVYVDTLMSLAKRVGSVPEKVELLQLAVEVLLTRFANHSRAAETYQEILDLAPDNAAAREFLEGAYEKRRDWEKLLALRRREVESLPNGPLRTARFVEMAKLATARIRKSEVTVDLWRTVLDGDPENSEALTSLASLYERVRDFEALAKVLEKQIDSNVDAGQKGALLAKLGQLVGDRLLDDEGAARAWRQLLALDPNDRRAQEALKKKYLALGRWDELDVFYEESGKWDELIRALETREAKESDSAVKIGVLMKIAQLWVDKKGKLDRAAKSYTKALELDAQHQGAAEALAALGLRSGATQKPSGASPMGELLRRADESADDPGEQFRLLADVLRRAQGSSPMDTAASPEAAPKSDRGALLAPEPTRTPLRRIAVYLIGAIERAVLETAIRAVNQAQSVFRFILEPARLELPLPGGVAQPWDLLRALLATRRAASAHGWAFGVLDVRLEGNWFSRYYPDEHVAFLSVAGWQYLSHLPCACQPPTIREVRTTRGLARNATPAGCRADYVRGTRRSATKRTASWRS